MRATWILVAAFSLLWLVLGWQVRDQARSHDFLSFYTGAYLVSHGPIGSLYDPAVQTETQKQWAQPGATVVPYTRPPFYALFLAPLCALPFRAAFPVWMALQIAVLLVCWSWGWRRFGPHALLFASMSVPAALGIAHGQDCALFLAVLIASYSLAEEHPLASGAVLGLLLVKFHLAPLWPVALVVQHRWKALAGFAATGAAVGTVSLAMIGTDGVRAYAALLRNPALEWVSPSPELTIGIRGLAANLGIASPIALAAALAAVVALFFAAVWRAPLWCLYAATTAASLLLVPHVYGYDAAMLLLGLWLASFLAVRQPARTAALWLFTPFPFSFTLLGKPWAALGSLSLLAFFITLALEQRPVKFSK